MGVPPPPPRRGSQPDPGVQIVGTQDFASHSTSIRTLGTGQYLACVVGDAKGEGARKPLKIVFTLFLRVRKIPIGNEAPEGIRVRFRRENCQLKKALA